MIEPPKRRPTRQRSGYTVSGDRSGNETKIVSGHAYQVLSPALTLGFKRVDEPLVPQFEEEIGMAAIGGYVKCEEPFALSMRINVLDPLDDEPIITGTKEIERPRQKRIWHKFGAHVLIQDPHAYPAVSLSGEITLTADKPLGWATFLGVNLATVSEYDTQDVVENFGSDALADFMTKTYLYYPEIYYWTHERPFTPEPYTIDGEISQEVQEGDQLVLKACNRCARFLPIDVIDERHTLAFSNHCVSRAPCTHAGFSRFEVENCPELGSLDEGIRDKISLEDDTPVLRVHYGFQLECRPCKKFRVNKPLNPLRNDAQRREDSLRRRAHEQLLIQLLSRDWVFYKYRRQGRDEFDTHIWDKFDRKCFACGHSLPQVGDMDLDHTLPLAYLWPLDDTATCLCPTCNSQKRDKFPYEFDRYRQPGKLEELAELTGLPEPRLRNKTVNPRAVAALQSRIEWFFDDFLADRDYQKIREGKKAADLIVNSIQKVLDECNVGLDLVQAYIDRTGRFPHTITLDPSN